MSLEIRRKATQREMEQGMQEMQLAQQRMEKETIERGEEPREDGETGQRKA